MAYPTSVNNQITDVLNGSVDGNLETLPEQVLKASHAFTQTLEMENRVLQDQCNGVVKMAVDVMEQTIRLCNEAVAIKIDNDAIQQSLANLKQQALSAIQNINAPAGNTTVPALAATSPAEPQDLDSVLASSVGQSYQNAVTAQQQAIMTMQAACTMGISTLYSVVTAAIGVAVSDALKPSA